MSVKEKTGGRGARVLNPRSVKIGRMIKARREEMGLSQAKLARNIGIAQPSLTNIESGESARSRYLPNIERELKMPPGTLTFNETNRPAIGYLEPNGEAMTGRRDFPVYFMKLGTEAGSVVLSAEAIEYVERPPLLATVQESFGICVSGDDMSPAYKTGDIVFVHPYQPPVVGSDIVLRPTAPEDMRVLIGQLEDETATEWSILQHRRNRTIRLKKSEWGRVDCIVGKYNRR